MKRAFAILMLLSGCAAPQVAARSLAALPVEARLDLLEAENDLFIAIDAADEASARLADARDEYRGCAARIDEAEEAVDQAEDAADSRLAEIARLSVQEAEQRCDYLESAIEVERRRIDVERARLDLARARLERTRAQAVKRANVEGAADIDLADFDEVVSEREGDVKGRQERASAEAAGAQKLRDAWQSARRTLAQKTGGGQGSPWVQ